MAAMFNYTADATTSTFSPTTEKALTQTLSLPLIIGIAISAFAFVVLIAIFTAYILLQKRRKTKKNEGVLLFLFCGKTILDFLF
jgi:hypothetical protein